MTTQERIHCTCQDSRIHQLQTACKFFRKAAITQGGDCMTLVQAGDLLLEAGKDLENPLDSLEAWLTQEKKKAEADHEWGMMTGLHGALDAVQKLKAGIPLLPFETCQDPPS